MNDYFPGLNCTSLISAKQRIITIENHINKHDLRTLSDSFANKTCKILEIWAWNWAFMQALKNEWFEDIRWLDIVPRWNNHPEISKLIQRGTIQNMRRGNPKGIFEDNTYDLVVSYSVFDRSIYREQNDWMYKFMLEEVHRVIKRGGLYFASEKFEKEAIIKVTQDIQPRENTIIKWEFIEAAE